MSISVMWCRVVLCCVRDHDLLTQVETEVFDKIDDLIASGRGDEEYRELFQDMSVI